MSEPSTSERKTGTPVPATRAALALAAALAVLAALAPTAAIAQEEVFVPHANAGDAAVRIFQASQNGDEAPTRSIAGGASGITFPLAAAVDPCASEVAITNADTASGQVSVRVYRWIASGGEAPLRVIQGAATRLADPQGIAIARGHDEIVVANLFGGSRAITVYDRLLGGDQPPRRSLGGPATGIVQPWGVAYDAERDEIVVASSGNASIRVFDRTARDDLAPKRTIAGALTGLGQIRGVAVDPARDVIAVADLAGSVKIFGRLDDGDLAPRQVLAGLQKPIGVAFGEFNGDLFVTEASPHNRVRVFARNGGGAYALARTIAGPSTGLNGPTLPAVFPAAQRSARLLAAVLPLSRSVQVGGLTATAFVTIINTGASPACQVRIEPRLPVPAVFFFQRTDPATNQPVGPLNDPVSIPPGGARTFIIGFTPTAAFGPVDMPFDFAGTNTLPVPVLVGINTLLLSASLTPVPDVVALAATFGNDGIVRIPGPPGTGTFAVATSNLGTGDNITVSADTGATPLPLAILVCRTDLAGFCDGRPAPSITVLIGAGATPTFGFFVSTSTAIGLDAAANRVFVRFRDSNGIVRGATGVAVTTDP